MKIFLSGVESTPYALPSYRERSGADFKPPYILESFVYRNKASKESQNYAGELLLDSGAFTFMRAKSKGGDGIDWNRYVDEYADYVLAAHSVSGIVNYMELDIDNVVGYQNVLKLRARLEGRVGRPSIPVWHRERGKEDFIAMCRDYDYVAIGGIASKQIKRSEFKYFPWFIESAHEFGAKIHGLGFTIPRLLPICHFDSVDSSSWYGTKYGIVYQFADGVLHREMRPGRITKSKLHEARVLNFIAWVKYQQWADVHY